MLNRETYNLEFKSKLTDSFLKTVSAFANYNYGEIIFGLDDNGRKVNIDNLKDLALNIENKINDNISPRPDYRIEIDKENCLLILKIHKGDYMPYLFKNKAYMRRDSASLPIEDRDEMKRLILEGLNLDFEDLQSNQRTLTFLYLEKYLSETLKIEKLDRDILKTLGLYTDKNGYNIAAELVSDKNSFKILDIVKFGKNISEFMERIEVKEKSILMAFDTAIEVYRRYFSYEKIEGKDRIKIEKIPEDAFREALANAIVHRNWSIDASIKIEMDDEHIEISSPGGLPVGISEEEYINGQVSILRNEKIGSLFNRLRLIEKFGTGIRRIKYLYRDSIKKPIFKVYPNAISINLPILTKEVEGLNENSLIILSHMTKGQALSRLEIDKISNFDKSKTLRALELLIKEGLILKKGKGRGTKYIKI